MQMGTGTWAGHVLPGTFLFALGFAWAVKTSYRYFFSYGNVGDKISQRRCVVKFDIIEALCKIFSATFGLVIEQVLPWEPQFHVVDPKTHEFTTHDNSWTHSTMYGFFALSGIVDMLAIKLPKTMPHCLHHYALALAFGIEGYLFYFHTHGREELDVRMHALLLFAVWPTNLLLIVLAMLDNNDNMANCYEYSVLAKNQHIENYRSNVSDAESAVSSLNEGHNTCCEKKSTRRTQYTEMDSLHSKRPRIAEESESLSRRKKIFTTQLGIATMIILQGTWFWQIATVLYPKSGDPWEENSRLNITFATLFFTWHLMVAILIVWTIFAIFWLISRRRRRLNGGYVLLHS